MNLIVFTHIFGLRLFCFYNDPSKNLRPFNRKSIIETLPNVVNNFITLPDGKVVYSGTILQRPLKHLPFPDDFLHHEGVVIGTTAGQEEIILEMNETSNRSGIHNVSLRNFLNPYGFKNLVVNYEPSTPIDIAVLLSRAKEYDYHPYNVNELNCIDFAKWLVFEEKRFSFKEMQIEKCDVLIAYYKDILSETIELEQKEQTQKELDHIITRKKSLMKEIESMSVSHAKKL